ncbi:hypothetical protein [Streptomyces sp. V1I1]|uniref:hypothetical protein n=1 Tax=Streptomyces sp. V1I1 TaxID=3042272 RepID=UPI0027D7954E|nr:hypothetical protein [Streptomyces sp. V1I1]
MAFKGHPAEAARVRQWTRGRLTHDDAPAIANELFIAILGSRTERRPDVIEMTISTAGSRARISATGYRPLPVLQIHGPGALIVNQLSHSSGVSIDGSGLWAQLRPEVAK